MDERLRSIVDNVRADELEAVMRMAIGSPAASLVGRPEFSEITAPHNDLRTIGIVRAAGRAEVDGTEKEWSGVLKIIDIQVDSGGAAYWVHPEQEEMVYERGLFSSDVVPFRAAACFGVSSPQPALKLIWLEDLSTAEHPPFSIDQMEQIGHHVGEFNAYYLHDWPDLPFVPSMNSYWTRWSGAGFPERIADLLTVSDHEVTRRMYGDVPLQTAIDLHANLDDLNNRMRKANRSLAFGDCQVGNLFLDQGKTVAIDWASLSLDPIGVDAGVLIGAGITRGRQGTELAHREREIYDSYVQGLCSRGWEGDQDDVRRAFFGQFGIYLVLVSTAPYGFSGGQSPFRRDFIEKRFETPWDDIPDLLSGLISLFPKYLDEVQRLLN